MKKKWVCIIDDDSIFVYGTKILLNHNKAFGDDILVCEDGQEALDTFRSLLKFGEDLPDFIFLDLNMPQLDGWQFLEEFESMTASIKYIPKIFLITSHVDGIIKEKAKSHHYVEALVEKPLSETKLQELLRKFS